MSKSNNKLSVFKSEEGKQIINERYEDILRLWPVDHERRFIETRVGDELVITHVLECGDTASAPLLLLHGTMSNSAAWIGDAAELSKSFRLIAADIPGEPGLSREYRFHPSGDEYSQWVESLLAGLGYQDSYVSIIGQSLGAFAAMKFAVKRPDRVESLSMLTVSGITPARVSFILKALPLLLLGKWGAGRIHKMISYKTDIGAEADAFGVLVSKHCRTMTEAIPLFTDEELGRLTMPIQFFGGDHDVLLNSEATAERLKRFVPQAEINLLNETGHVVIGQTKRIIEFMRAGLNKK